MMFSISLSLLTAFVLLYVGISHNAMGEFCKNADLNICDFDYSYAFTIWFSWVISTFIMLRVVLAIAKIGIISFKYLIQKF